MTESCDNYAQHFGELPNCFSKWMHHFKFSLSIHESLNCSTFPPALAIDCLKKKLMLLVHVKWYLIEFFICLSLKTHGDEHLFIYVLIGHLCLP